MNFVVEMWVVLASKSKYIYFYIHVYIDIVGPMGVAKGE